MIERKEIRENPTRKIPSRKIFRIKKTHREQVLTLPNFTRKESFVLARQILSKWINCSTVKLAVINGWRTVSFFSRERVASHCRRSKCSVGDQSWPMIEEKRRRRRWNGQCIFRHASSTELDGGLLLWPFHVPPIYKLMVRPRANVS